jgi:tetratricopeptide (TPR) repeat protein
MLDNHLPQSIIVDARPLRLADVYILAGGFTLAAASAVCAGEETAKVDMFDVLSSLVDKSLPVADFERCEPRYGLLESFREYAREKLTARGERELVAQRHARAYLKIAEQLYAARDTAELVGSEYARQELDNLDNLDNWRAALEWALAADGDVALGQRLAGELCFAWLNLVPVEGRRWIDLALHHVDEGTALSVLAKIWYARATVANRLEEVEKELASSEKALGLYRNLGDEKGIALSQAQLGRALVRLGRSEEAQPMLLEALTRLRQLGSGMHLGYALRVMSMVDSANGDFTAARSRIAEALAIYKGIGRHQAVGLAAIDLAEVEYSAGNVELAFQHAAEALATLQTFNDMWHTAESLNIMSACLISLERYEDAAVLARQSLVLSNELHASPHVALALQRLAVATLPPQGAFERCSQPYVRATRLFGFVAARLTDLGSPRMAMDQREYERVLSLLLGAMGPDKLACHMNAGAAMSEEQAIAEALADDI